MNKRILLAVGMIVALIVSSPVVLQDAVNASECRIIRVMEDKGATGRTLRIEPDKLQINKGTCVIWVNWVPKIDVRINFKEDGKRCMDATDSSPHFSATENCYLTDFLKLGGTSSLRFNDVGTYKYSVEVPGQRQQSPGGQTAVAFGEVKSDGEIIVSEE